MSATEERIATADGLTPAASDERRPASLLVVCALFVLSGSCGLAYEVVWAKYLGLFLGNGVLVHTAVLGTFMTGLAAGSLIIGRRAERIANPLKAYGWLELAIAGYAGLFPLLASAGQALVLQAAGPFPPGTMGLLVIRIAIGCALMLVPTVLMGATFPYLTSYAERTGNRGAAGANWLYFANCAGAVAGSLITGFALIPQLGLSGSLMAVMVLNVLVGALALLAGMAGSAPVPPAESEAHASGQGAAANRLVLAAVCVSGATAFVYELVWTRLFAVTLGSSTYSFTLMLSAFITGLALGSIAANALPGVGRSPLAWFARAEILIAMAMALAIPLYPRLPYLFWQWRWQLRPVAESIPLYHLFQYGITFLVMAVPTFLFGLTFPTAIRAASREDSVASHAAEVYGWNTVGTVAGVTLAGAVLIPLLGLQGTLRVAAALNLVIGCVLLYKASDAPPAVRRWALLAAPAALLLLLSPQWRPLSFTQGALRANVPPPADWSRYQTMLRSREPVFYREDLGTTVAVVRAIDPDSGQPQLGLIVDGKMDATSVGDLPTQTLLGQIPLVLKPESTDVFVLGLGSGVTAGSVLTHPVERVDCVEISKAVVDAARRFQATSGGPERDPRFHLTIDDGKTILASTRRKYDVIISEPTNPWIAGVGNLFSKESFEAAARALKPGGIAAQWFHAYQLDDPLVATIIRTFRSVFPHTIAFQGNSQDYILIGSTQPLPVDFSKMEERLKRPEVARDLSRINVTRLAALLALQTHTGEAVAALEENGGLNTDDFPLLETLAPHAHYLGLTAKKIEKTDCRYSRGRGLLLDHYLRGRPLDREELLAVYRTLSDPRVAQPSLSFRILHEYLARWPDDAALLLAAARFLESNGRVEQALAYARRASAAGNREGAQMAAALEARLHGMETSAFSSAPAPR